MINCPRCTRRIRDPLKEWDSDPFHVQRYYCRNCEKEFNAFYREKTLSYTEWDPEPLEGVSPVEAAVEETPVEAAVEETPVEAAMEEAPSEPLIEAPRRRVLRRELAGEIKRLYRSQDERIIAGVCGGIAEYFNVDPTLVRIAWVVFGFMGYGVISYLIAYLIMPEEPES
jgi:phage shock protein C